MDWSVTSGTLTRCMDLPNGINMSSSFFGLCPSALITETILALSETKVLSNQQPIVGSWKACFVLVVLHNIFQKSSWHFKLLLGCLQNASKSSGKWGIYNPDEIPEVDEKRRSSPANSIIQLTLSSPPERGQVNRGMDYIEPHFHPFFHF